MRSLLLQNLKLTIPTALAFTVLGYAVSLPMSFFLNPNAFRWEFNLSYPGGSIATKEISDLAKFQVMVALGGTVLGIVVGQTTFIVHAFAVSDRQNKE